MEGFLVALFVIFYDQTKQENSHQVGSSNPYLEDYHIMDKRIKLPPFCGEDPYSWVSKAESLLCGSENSSRIANSTSPDLYGGNDVALV